MASRQLVRISQSLRPSPRASQRMEQWGQPLRVILTDYAEVSKDLFHNAIKRPIKSLFYALTGTLVVTMWKLRPDYTRYVNDLLEYSNDLSVVSRPLRNPRAQSHIDAQMQLAANDQLYCISLGLCSLVMRRVDSPSCKNFHVTCKHLQPHMWTMWERVVDVGVWGKWVGLERKMADFDINEEELERSLKT